MHRECAKTMLRHMKLQCPLCRSQLVCSDCKSGKTSIRCICEFDTSSKQESLWEDMFQICKAHIIFSIGIFVLPFNPASLLALILLNCALMLRRIADCQRKSKEIKGWSPTHRNAMLTTQIVMDLTTFCLALLSAAVIVLQRFSLF